MRKRNLKKGIIVLLTIYIIGLLILAGYRIAKDSSSYFNYKKHIATIKKQLEKEVKNNTGEKVENNNEKVEVEVPVNNELTNNDQINNVPVNNEVEQYADITFDRILKTNSKGEDVKKLQYLLNKKGFYNGEITGKFGVETKKALVKFQEENNIIPADGILGKETADKLTK